MYEGSNFFECLPTPVTVYLLIMVILVDGKWCLIVILIGIFLQVKNVEHIFTCLLAICISPLAKYLFELLPVFKLVCFF